MGNMIWTPLDAPWYPIFSPKCLDAKLPFFEASIPIVWWFNPEISWILRVKPSNHHLLTSSHAERQGPKGFPSFNPCFFSSRNSKNSRPIFPTPVFWTRKIAQHMFFQPESRKIHQFFIPPMVLSRRRRARAQRWGHRLAERAAAATGGGSHGGGTAGGGGSQVGNLRGWWLDNSGLLLDNNDWDNIINYWIIIIGIIMMIIIGESIVDYMIPTNNCGIINRSTIIGESIG